MQDWMAIVISAAGFTIVVVSALVRLQAGLFQRIEIMMNKVVTDHSTNSEAHADIRSAIRSQKHYLDEYEKEQSLRWKEHDKWSQAALNELLAEIRNHKA